MQTRRELLEQAVSIPLAMCLRAAPQRYRLEIITETNCLSEESAEGFRALLADCSVSNVILVCGISRLNSRRAFDLRNRALRGAWVIWENSALNHPPQAQILKNTFGIELEAPFAVSPDRLYIKYNWPVPALTRTFSMVAPVSCAPAEVIARYRDVPVAMKRRIGRGGIVFLGSMLGPNLRAEEREANRIAAAIFSKITSADTSTEA